MARDMQDRKRIRPRAQDVYDSQTDQTQSDLYGTPGDTQETRMVRSADDLGEEELNNNRGVSDAGEGVWNIWTGMPVIGADSDEIGEVKDVRRSDFLVARPLARDIYVPFDAVMSTTDDQVTLTVSSDEVDNMGWAESDLPGFNNPPVIGQRRVG